MMKVNTLCLQSSNQHRDDCLGPGFVLYPTKHLNPATNQLYLACQRQNQQVEVFESMSFTPEISAACSSVVIQNPRVQYYSVVLL